MKKGKFIVIDGPDGSGKGTQVELLKQRLIGGSIVYTREPGGVDAAEQVRTLLNDVKTDSTPLADLFLFNAARALHMEKKVLPLLREGIHIITDRYDSSSFAYQLWGECATNKDKFEQLEKLFEALRLALPQEWVPDAYLFLQISPEVAHHRRLSDSTQEKSRFDLKPLAYHKDVGLGYRAFEKFSKSGPCPNGKNIQYFDAELAPQALHAELLATVQHILTQP